MMMKSCIEENDVELKILIRADYATKEWIMLHDSVIITERYTGAVLIDKLLFGIEFVVETSIQ